MKLKLIILLQILLLFWTPSLLAKNQETDTDFHWYLLPFPTSIPGIGSTIMIVGGAANVYKHLKVTGLYSTNPKIQIQIVSLTSIPLYPTWEGSFSIKRNLITPMVFERSIHSNSKDYYKTQHKTSGFSVGVSHTLWDEQIILSSKVEYKKSKINNFLDTDNNKLDNSYTGTSTSKDLSLMATLNLVNSDLNPTKGWRANLLFVPSLSNTDANEPDFSVLTENVTAYLPVFTKDTIVFNVFKSDAILHKQGLTDIDKLRKQYSLNCDLTDSDCLHIENERLRNLLAYHKHGDALSLGGDSRLRGYPQNRFVGAHSMYQGIEYRSNFYSVPTATFQAAFFAERGTVSDSHASFIKNYKNSYGVGLRILFYSFLYRFDFAGGSEGTEFSVIAGFPMQVSSSGT